MSRCTGHCCEEFTLNETIEKIREMARHHPNHEQQYLKILDMVYPVGPDLWSCKHFDAKSRNCMIYETRPPMCSSYPHGGECKRDGCTYKQEDQCPTTATALCAASSPEKATDE